MWYHMHYFINLLNNLLEQVLLNSSHFTDETTELLGRVNDLSIY